MYIKFALKHNTKVQMVQLNSVDISKTLKDPNIHKEIALNPLYTLVEELRDGYRYFAKNNKDSCDAFYVIIKKNLATSLSNLLIPTNVQHYGMITKIILQRFVFSQIWQP